MKSGCSIGEPSWRRRVSGKAFLFFILFTTLKTLIYKKINQITNYNISLRIWKEENAVNRFFKDWADYHSSPYRSIGRYTKKEKHKILLRLINRRTDLWSPSK